ncbi:hypothetical protein KP509_1Z213800 [Ceratopteris richardii]|nr:hypothetical protein KP509_1Z213800 [Ceratopteris richardii]
MISVQLKHPHPTNPWGDTDCMRRGRMESLTISTTHHHRIIIKAAPITTWKKQRITHSFITKVAKTSRYAWKRCVTSNSDGGKNSSVLLNYRVNCRRTKNQEDDERKLY